MSAKQAQQPGDGLTSHIAGMSKSQLFDIMCQMKALIDQDREQARKILVDNPALTRALFQAQIMLGMVKPPQTMPDIQTALSQAQPSEVGQPSNVQPPQSMPIQPGPQTQTSASQTSVPPTTKPQHPVQPPTLPSSSLVPPLTFPPQTAPSNPPQPVQTKAFSIAQFPPVSFQQPSQIHSNVSLPSPSAPPQYMIPPQQPLQTPGVFNQQLQPPLPQHPRPLPHMQSFSHPIHSQMPHGLGFQPSSAQPLLQPMFTGQPPLPNQPPPQQLYQAERGAPWVPGRLEISSAGPQILGRPPMPSGQMVPGMGSQAPRPPPLTAEMEKALLQQVLSLTQDQINMLPAEQRQQVLQLQEMLRLK
ncbi:vegetative cell wall protein gp1 isoform X2 [Ananas comosus]|uniref:Vegetative cell wall protein gp1 isoform X2 n=1 Tax=Ananas comosus TaxID=4615 RepID=A0A6P5F1M2_ANACO|nr:vegetative cell wall protein gp1 isoform X2 [Ananas comosus]